MHIKRVFDVVVVSLAAVVWLPAVVGGALLILLTAGRPVFYRSNRLVGSGDPTKVVKFRTMVKNADKLVNRDTVPVTNTRFLNIAPDSPLYTRAGRLLERCGLTEIPQLVHVLSGKMSIVGNRPLPTNVMNALLDEYSYAGDRFLTAAGLTGPAQLVGRDALTDSERLRIEGAYCHAVLDGYRLRLDFTILLRTVLIVAHLKPSLSYGEVMDLIARNSGSRAVVALDEHASPRADNTEVA
ncbi:sugar transferase [Nocardioides carbamazepini]|uniref:sugar transferase n=1 Tax=Nocardioides carbamazepini TaxID=2854259 RepID=UPI00214A2F2A|nr:sugar transferase [Nocardioides carbamazepini]MCR1786175.1 sugar transferase [Nocardioides carbamazepini]